MRGQLITLEGPEGAGKSTQLKLLATKLQEGGYEVICTREPGGGGPLSEKLRELLLSPETGKISIEAELFLILAARSEHMQNVILPGLRKGALVLCDRFIDSTLAYQGYGRGIAIEMIKTLNRFAIQGRYPDLTIVFNIPPEEGLVRAGKNSVLDRIEGEEIAFHERLAKGFLDIAEESSRYYVIDASKSVEQVFKEIWDRLKLLLPDEN